MKLLVFGDLMEKINKEYDVSRVTAYSMASKIVNKCPKRLYINIMECHYIKECNKEIFYE